jgi:hypothetical protein
MQDHQPVKYVVRPEGSLRQRPCQRVRHLPTVDSSGTMKQLAKAKKLAHVTGDQLERLSHHIMVHPEHACSKARCENADIAAVAEIA